MSLFGFLPVLVNLISYNYFSNKRSYNEKQCFLSARELGIQNLIFGYVYLLLQAIAKDAVLSRCKIIAEPWDCGGLYLVGSFPNWDRYFFVDL